jgi:hypothetical protein
MRRILSFAILLSVLCPAVIESQQAFRLPDIRSMKHLTSRAVDHCTEIPGKQTTQDFYSGSGGLVVTVYSFRGRNVGFSTHYNSDPQTTYKMFLDFNGDGMFRQIDPSVKWQLPAWSRR